MKKEEVALHDNSQLLALEECEKKIQLAFRRGRDATVEIGRQFRKIEEEELFRERGHKKFLDYVQKDLQLDWGSVRRIQRITTTVERLTEAGMEPPLNETQADQLSRLELEIQPQVWQKILDVAEMNELPITTQVVHEAVERAKTLVRPGVMIPLEVDEPGDANGEGAPKRAPKIQATGFTDKGEIALERIKRLCGEPVAKAITTGNLPMSERELRRWADEEDEMVKALAHYVVDLRWDVGKAIQFENAGIGPQTTIAELVEMTHARQGGRLSFLFDKIRINVELLAA